ncbi:ferredoxin [Streptomyces sp. A1499]|uniref:ferredoxin n=1 Tax=Streptomyces sp. A1499 TaxID=2563104 RepID=UPI001F0D5F03|nr:ferredoxin [Streptomyces sp. A1499]
MTATTPLPSGPRAVRPAPAPTEEPQQWDRPEPVRYLEARFACAQACDECVRACARSRPAGGPGHALRLTAACADVCDATFRVLAERGEEDEQRVRVQVEWCRAVCRQCAALCATCPASAGCAEACRRCERACDDLMKALTGPATAS